MPPKESLDLIEKVNSLYSGALSQLTTLYTETMSQLIMITVSVLALVGVIIPALVSWLQSRQINKEQKLLRAEIDNQVQIALQDLKKQFAIEFAKKSTEFQAVLDESKQNFAKELERIEADSDAKTLHLQAKHQLTNKNYVESAESALGAMEFYVKSNNEVNLRRVWKVANVALNNLNSKSFQKNTELEQKIQDATKAVTRIDSNGRYADLIDEIQRASKDAKAKT
jgi:hypothetical protein